MADSPSPSFRWQSCFQRAAEPLFLLNGHRRILFVNQAWEQLTGLTADEARGLRCARRASVASDEGTALAQILCPPPEVLDGKPGRVQRVLPGGSGSAWWTIEFFPLQDERGLLCVLGKITVASDGHAALPIRLPERLVALRDTVAMRHAYDLPASDVPAVRRVASQVRLASQTRAPVLILGETGTGKQWVARSIHYQGVTREQTCAILDCTRLPASTLAWALHGRAGLLTRAGMGTVYLGQPSHLPRDLQAHLHDWLSSLPAATLVSPRLEMIGPRLVAGCVSDPGAEVLAGRLLEELHCALGTMAIVMPPLRLRLLDLPWLVKRMLPRASAATGHEVYGLTSAVWELFHGYSWPGNLRELYNVLASGCMRARGDQLTIADLPAHVRLANTLAEAPAADQRSLPLDHLLEQAERRLIELALRLCHGNKSRAAEMLSIWRPRLHRRMQALGIAAVEGTADAVGPVGAASQGADDDPEPEE